MAGALIDLEREGGVATLRFDDPERRNAMTQAMGEAFADQLADLRADPSLRALVLTGAGSAFSAGGDLGMIEGKADQAQASPGRARRAVREGMRSFYGLFLSVRDLPCPVIAAINGHAIGAGLCVALACDLRLVAREAKLALNFTRLGIHPGMGATWILPRLVGPALAAELLYTGRVIRGDEAAEFGMVNRALPQAEVLAAAQALAAEIAAAAPLAVTGTKRALARSPEASLDEQLTFEATEQALCFESEDVREGLAAARARRDPEFSGR